jgi:phosphoglycolate phosphatase-like HAD superfamily hydrolase
VFLQGIIFDVDSTLVDSNEAHVHAEIGKGGDLLAPDLLNAKEMRRFGQPLQEYRSKLYRQKYCRTYGPSPACGSCSSSSERAT